MKVKIIKIINIYAFSENKPALTSFRLYRQEIKPIEIKFLR